MKSHFSKFLKKSVSLVRRVAKPPAYVFFASCNRYRLSHPDTLGLPSTTIGEGTMIHPQAFVAERGVVIGNHCKIDASAVILERTILEDGARVMGGSVIGTESFVRLKVGKHITLRRSRGGVVIGERAIIGPHSCVDRAWRKGNTRVGNDSRVGSNVHVAHDLQIGRNCTIGTGAMLAGMTSVNDGAVLGYDCSISNDLLIGERAVVHSGAVVTKDVPANAAVSGNFAIDHLNHRRTMNEAGRSAGGIIE